MSLLSFSKKLGAKEKVVTKKPAKKSAVAVKEVKSKQGAGRQSLEVKQIGLMPMITERSVALQEQGVAVFRVDVKANKIQIRKAVEAKYGVKVLGVRTMRMSPKWRRRGNSRGRTNYWKKALIKVNDVQSLVSGP